MTQSAMLLPTMKPRKTPSATGARKSVALRVIPDEPAVLTLTKAALEDMKALDVRVIDVRGISDVADYMVVATGTSDRHLRAVAGRAVQIAKVAGFRPHGIEGEQQGEWVLVDLPDVMLHVMLASTREFYQLEQLWEVAPRALVQEPKAVQKLSRQSMVAKGPARKRAAVPKRRSGAARKAVAPRKQTALRKKTVSGTASGTMKRTNSKKKAVRRPPAVGF